MRRTYSIAAGLTLALSIVSWPAQAGESYRWVQYVPGGLEARAITDKAACPQATLDGAAAAMTVRSEPGKDYPILTCALPIPAGTKAAAIAGVPLALPKARPNRILVIGDTGCRLKGKLNQACNDAELWPFRLGSDVAATMKPDLVIDVGDYHYRETECPTGNLGCAGSPFGDTWDVWKADFFAPAELLLNSSPWVQTRGNHEECERGGKGWARTLDPMPWSATSGKDGCLAHAAPFTVDLGGVSLVVMDVATADEEKPNPEQAKLYKAEFESVSSLVKSGPAWMSFHRPIWATDGSSGPNVGGDNKTLALAAQGSIPANVQLFLSGHQHTFSVASYEEDLPIQIVSGHGGDLLSPDAPTMMAGLKVNGMTIKAGVGKPRTFGFSMLERAAPDDGMTWTLTDYDTHGVVLNRCAIKGRQVTC